MVNVPKTLSKRVDSVACLRATEIKYFHCDKCSWSHIGAGLSHHQYATIFWESIRECYPNRVLNSKICLKTASEVTIGAWFSVIACQGMSGQFQSSSYRKLARFFLMIGKVWKLNSTTECFLLCGQQAYLRITSSNFKNKDYAKSDCFCDFYAFFKTRKRWGTNATLYLRKGCQLKTRSGTYAID